MVLEVNSTFSPPAPFASRSFNAQWPLRLDAYTTREPSRVHSGRSVQPGLNVSGLSAPASTTQMSDVPTRASLRAPQPGARHLEQSQKYHSRRSNLYSEGPQG
jgi:hypothetical protein